MGATLSCAWSGDAGAAWWADRLWRRGDAHTNYSANRATNGDADSHTDTGADYPAANRCQSPADAGRCLAIGPTGWGFTFGPARRERHEVVNIYPHDPAAFTQGLLFDEGQLYESTGLYGASSVRRVDLATGQVLSMTTIPAEYFGEGISIVNDRLYQLTWQEQTGFIYNKTTFAPEGRFRYATEGWGMTFDGKQLIMSDGTARLYFWDPATLTTTHTIDVYDDQGPVVRLNELEYIQGEIFANIWQTDLIARIDPATGTVTGWIDLTGLLPAADRTPATDVLNGIAYLPEGDRLFVTGKNWPKLFEIRLTP